MSGTTRAVRRIVGERGDAAMTFDPPERDGVHPFAFSPWDWHPFTAGRERVAGRLDFETMVHGWWSVEISGPKDRVVGDRGRIASLAFHETDREVLARGPGPFLSRRRGPGKEPPIKDEDHEAGPGLRREWWADSIRGVRLPYRPHTPWPRRLPLGRP